MEVTLPSGHKATFRDTLMRGDIREARRGMVFVTSADGSRRTDGAFLDDLTGRVIARMFVSWDFPGMDLRNAQGEHLAQQILDGLDSEDYAALEEAVGPWVQRMLKIGQSGYSFTHNETGVRVDISDSEQAAKLAASPDFTAIEGTGPKAPRTAITGSASPGGPETPQDPTP